MDSRSLLLLGMLMAQSRHGYQINEIIEQDLSCLIDIKKSTAYTILDRLSDAGLVSMTTEQEGNRPPRKVYSITPLGEGKFIELLKVNLESLDPLYFEEDIGLMYIDHVSRQEAHNALKEKLLRVDEQIAIHESVPHHGFGIGVDLAIRHHLTLLAAEKKWLLEVMQELMTEQNGNVDIDHTGHR